VPCETMTKLVMTEDDILHNSGCGDGTISKQLSASSICSYSSGSQLSVFQEEEVAAFLLLNVLKTQSQTYCYHTMVPFHNTKNHVF